jgi:hypothetical protein
VARHDSDLVEDRWAQSTDQGVLHSSPHDKHCKPRPVGRGSVQDSAAWRSPQAMGSGRSVGGQGEARCKLVVHFAPQHRPTCVLGGARNESSMALAHKVRAPELSRSQASGRRRHGERVASNRPCRTSL